MTTKLKIVCISDTHNKHKQLTIPDGDVIIHAGDMTSRGWSGEFEDFIKWYAKLPHTYKIVIAGNHDWGLDDNQLAHDKWALRRQSFAVDAKEVSARMEALMKASGIIYLKDSSVNIHGVKFYGSPVSPDFHGWAFNRYRGPDIKKHWDAIPDDTNVLITHGPPLGIGDKTDTDDHVGDVDLSNRIRELVYLKVHVCGHIHEDRGIQKVGSVTYINASSLNLMYQPYAVNTFTVDYEDL